MVYDSDFYTTRRTYSRPAVTSYTVTYPVRVSTPTVTTKVYTSSYPIYSYSSSPYVVKRTIPGSTRVRVITTPIRVVHSPARYVRSSVTPIRVISSPVRSIISPIRTYYSPVRTYYSPIRSVLSPIRSVVSPIRVFTSEREITTPTRVFSTRSRPSVLLKEYDRILNRPRPRVGYSPLEEYLNSDTFINFDDEARKIRSSAATLMREIHTPVLRYTRSVTPFPVSKYDPITPYALEAYLARIRNPTRHVVNEIHNLTNYQEPLRTYSDKVRNDVEYLSRYLKNRMAAKEILEGKFSRSIDAKEIDEQ